MSTTTTDLHRRSLNSTKFWLYYLSGNLEASLALCREESARFYPVRNYRLETLTELIHLLIVGR